MSNVSSRFRTFLDPVGTNPSFRSTNVSQYIVHSAAVNIYLRICSNDADHLLLSVSITRINATAYPKGLRNPARILRRALSDTTECYNLTKIGLFGRTHQSTLSTGSHVNGSTFIKAILGHLVCISSFLLIDWQPIAACSLGPNRCI
jgi:hypothetical protein